MIGDMDMPDDQMHQIKISFSPAAQDYIRRFTDSVRRQYPGTDWVPCLDWVLETVFKKPNGEVMRLGPHFVMGATDPKTLAGDIIVPADGVDVAIRLSENLELADRLEFNFVNDEWIVTGG